MSLWVMGLRSNKYKLYYFSKNVDEREEKS